MPDWNSISDLQVWRNYLLLTAAVLTGFGLFIGIVAEQLIGRRIEHLREQKDEQFQRSLKNTELDSQKAQDEQSRKLSEAEAAFEAARLRVQMLEAKQAPRRLTGAELQLFVRFLRERPHQTVKVRSLAGDAEVHAYTSDIVHALQEAGWSVEDVGISRTINIPPIVGVWIHVNNINEMPMAAQILDKAFNQTGIRPSVVTNPDTPEQVCELLIGQKPID